MMKILHIYPKDDNSLARYVALLIKALPEHVESRASDDPVAAKKMCKEWQPDIIHLYGSASCDVSGRRVISPCGVPVAKQPTFYAVIARSPLEAETLSAQGVKRVEIIRNPLVTKTTNFDETAQKTAYVYQKVMDSHPLPLLSETTRTLLYQLLKAAVCGDKRWVVGFTAPPSDVNYRLLFHYADLEGVLPLVQKGLNILGIEAPVHQKIACYLPDGYQQPVSMSGRDIMDMLNDIQDNGLTLLRLVNVFEALHAPSFNEDQFMKRLDNESLSPLFRSILSIAQELLALEEGFMPCEPIDNGDTRKLRDNINNHLRL